MDEFSSRIDRPNARSLSVSLARYVRFVFEIFRVSKSVCLVARRKRKKRRKQRTLDCFRPDNMGTLILGSCHADIIRWLQPEIVVCIDEDHMISIRQNPSPYQKPSVKVMVCVVNLMCVAS